jgi:hypothetical protein
MIRGQKVVCIDDDFEPILRSLYAELPKKGAVYTIREVFLGRSKALAPKAGMSDGEVGLLLEELLNPPDPMHQHGQELGFRSTRFAPLEELTEDETAEAEEELFAPA